jgi:Tfp pilus assembly protein FimV
MSYCGLARLCLKSGDHEAARDHYKKALGIAQYNSVKKEAEKFLNKNRNIN